MPPLPGAAIDRAAAAIRGVDHVVAFTGAGVSTESGIPDFRSPGGLWDRVDRRDVTIEALRRDPAAYWDRRRELAAARGFEWDAVEPNPAHDALARLYCDGSLACVITQNVDGLHQVAGVDAEDVLELHGTRSATKCLGCRERRPLDELESKLERVDVPRCGDCGGLLKHATVSFGERLPVEVLDRARRECRRADAMVVVGSSLTVEPAASLPREATRSGATLVIVNLDRTPLGDEATAVVTAEAGTVLPRLATLVIEGG